jgi:uncharacterized membrane protein YhaH (DUF805 family)
VNSPHQPQNQKARFSLAAAMVWVFARFDGRIGREVFWLGNIFLISMLAVLVRPTLDPETGEVALQSGGIGVVFMIAAMVSTLAIGAKRFHDLNVSGLFTVLLLIPVVSILVTIGLGVIPGHSGPNAYGERTDVPPA